ncbi:MAG: Rrf2 family transcriptional regulator [Lachnospiraceae bacterium]|nr:Rrf2 family transcriptional regulator [Lachnospiraceae bacterium]
MKVSTRVEYGLIALTDIVIHSGMGQSVSGPEISARQHISQKYLEQILLLLRQAGFITAQKGLRGGYALSRPPENISMSDVLNALDGNILADLDDGGQDGDLRTVIKRCFWSRINSSLNKYTDSLTLGEFAEGCRSCFSDTWDMYVI